MNGYTANRPPWGLWEHRRPQTDGPLEFRAERFQLGPSGADYSGGGGVGGIVTMYINYD